MSSFVYPAALPGLTFNNTRSPNFNTGVQPALSGKESCLAYQLYPIMEFDLQYEYLDGRNQSNSDIRALLGLFMAMKGQADNFLFNDPEFNTVSLMPFATTDGVTTAFQTTATYQNIGGPGGPELIQNLNGAPNYYLNRFGFPEWLSPFSSQTRYLKFSTDQTNAAWTDSNVNVSFAGSIATIAGINLATCLLNEINTLAGVEHYIAQGQTVPATTGIDYTFSGFFQGASRGWCIVRMIESTSNHYAYCSFNLVTGAIGTPTITGANWSNIRVSMTPSTSSPGWYKCTVTATKQSAATGINCVASAATGDAAFNYTGSIGTQAILTYGLQLEQGFLASATLVTAGSQITGADYALGATGIIATSLAYAANLQLLWSGSFFYRCRFTDDKMTVSQFVNKFWENKSVTLRQKKL